MPKVRPHLKIHLSLFSHRKTARIGQDNDLLAVYVRLGCFMMKEYAACTKDTVVATIQDLMTITGRRHPGYALKVMARLCAATDQKPWITVTPLPYADLDASSREAGEVPETSVRVSSEVWPEVYSISVPNFRRKQGFTEGAPVWANGSEPVEAESESETEAGKKRKSPTQQLNGRKERQKLLLSDARRSGRTPVELAKRAWPDCVAAAAEYGKRWSKKPSETRARALAARLREHPKEGPEILPRAIHGAVKFWGGMDSAAPGSDFDPMRALNPETIFRPANFDKYLEAAIMETSKPNTRAAAQQIRELERKMAKRNA